MRVILLERIRSLGFMGDIVNVKPGYGRNYLLPQKKALRATDANIKVFEGRKQILEAENLKHRQEAEKVRDKVGNIYVTLERNAAETGQLYGSVNDRDVAEALTAKGLKVERKQVFLNAPIKQSGVYKVVVALHPEVEMDVLVAVASSLSAAEGLIQAELNPPVEASEAKQAKAKKTKSEEVSSDEASDLNA